MVVLLFRKWKLSSINLNHLLSSTWLVSPGQSRYFSLPTQNKKCRANKVLQGKDESLKKSRAAPKMKSPQASGPNRSNYLLTFPFLILPSLRYFPLEDRNKPFFLHSPFQEWERSKRMLFAISLFLSILGFSVLSCLSINTVCILKWETILIVSSTIRLV